MGGTTGMGGGVNGQITGKDYIENEDSYIRNHLFKKDVSYVETSRNMWQNNDIIILQMGLNV